MEVSNLHHMNGVRINFGIDDKKQCLISGISNESLPLSVIVSSVKGTIEAQQTLFESLWEQTIPAKQRISCYC